MSTAEIKVAIDRLSADEFEDVAQYLRARQLARNPEYRARVARSHQQIDSKRSVTLDQLKDLIVKNEAAARRAS
jgi:hypothetical protein